MTKAPTSLKKPLNSDPATSCNHQTFLIAPRDRQTNEPLAHTVCPPLLLNDLPPTQTAPSSLLFVEARDFLL